MKSLLQFSLVLLVVLLSSCRILFENPLKVVPNELIGTYLEQHESDTLFITQNSYKYGHSDQMAKEMNYGSLDSGKDVLKKFGKYYVYSKSANDSANQEPRAWYVFLVKLEEKNLLVSQVETDSYNEKDTLDIGLLRKVTPVKTMNENGKNDNAYLINPDKKQFKSMIDKGLFKTAYRFKRID